ncbi:MAG: alpha/beta fold hydrolase [Azospirillum sp.]|nr:alpha/beta fold hydrolase [Azospirillum sp.]
MLVRNGWIGVADLDVILEVVRMPREFALTLTNGPLFMTLEIIARVPPGAGRRPPLLFVHGTNSGAWLWDRHFLPWFALRGHAAYAVSLRGHGQSDGAESLSWLGLSDYVADVVAAAQSIDPAPVLVGHSMGGFLVQRCLETLDVPGVVLMASLPPAGLAPVAWRMMATDPVFYQRVAAVQTMWGASADAEATVRQMLFAPDTPESVVAEVMPRWQPESPRAVADLMWASWWPILFAFKPKPTLPVLVLGAGSDRLVAPEFIAETGRWFGTEAEMFPGMGHAMMLEPSWLKVAERILRWLESVAQPD